MRFVHFVFEGIKLLGLVFFGIVFTIALIVMLLIDRNYKISKFTAEELDQFKLRS